MAVSLAFRLEVNDKFYMFDFVFFVVCVTPFAITILTVVEFPQSNLYISISWMV